MLCHYVLTMPLLWWSSGVLRAIISFSWKIKQRGLSIVLYVHYKRATHRANRQITYLIFAYDKTFTDYLVINTTRISIFHNMYYFFITRSLRLKNSFKKSHTPIKISPYKFRGLSLFYVDRQGGRGSDKCLFY